MQVHGYHMMRGHERVLANAEIAADWHDAIYMPRAPRSTAYRFTHRQSRFATSARSTVRATLQSSRSTEDSVLLREGLVRLLTEAGIEVIGHAGDARARRRDRAVAALSAR